MRLPRLLPAAVLIVGVALFLAGPVVLGANDNFGLDTAAGSTIPHTTDIAVVIGKIVRQVLAFVGTIFLLLMIYAGFTYMLARGDDKKISTAKGIISGAVIGIIIVALSYSLTSFVIGSLSSTTTSSGPGENGNVAGQKEIGESCTSASECASGVCVASGGGSPTCGARIAEGGTCQNDNQCESGLCINQRCRTGNQPINAVCFSSRQCTSGNCEMSSQDSYGKCRIGS